MIIASQKRSNSASDSLSVGSIIKVPGTGNDMVGAWKPKSIRSFGYIIHRDKILQMAQVNDTLMGNTVV